MRTNRINAEILFVDLRPPNVLKLSGFGPRQLAQIA